MLEGLRGLVLRVEISLFKLASSWITVSALVALSQTKQIAIR